jgi:hypothetical protein
MRARSQRSSVVSDAPSLETRLQTDCTSRPRWPAICWTVSPCERSAIRTWSSATDHRAYGFFISTRTVVAIDRAASQGSARRRSEANISSAEPSVSKADDEAGLVSGRPSRPSELTEPIIAPNNGFDLNPATAAERHATCDLEYSTETRNEHRALLYVVVRGCPNSPLSLSPSS